MENWMANLTPRCWNCGSVEKWTEIAAMEKCDACGIACYYHGDGANQAYDDASDEKHARARREEEAAEQKEREMWERQNYIDDLYY
jgi:predicted  nucleic acid-binding Zn-ribbon protein